MKRFIIPILLSALFVLSTQAQDKKFEFSLKGGYSYNMPNTASDTLYNSAGVHFGPMITFNINESFGIQAGLLYNYYASSYLLDAVSLKKLGTYKQNSSTAQYVELPLRFQYSAVLTDEITARVFAGPNFSYALNRKTYFERYKDHEIQAGYPSLLKDYYSPSSYFSHFDAQFGIGASIQYLKYSIYGTYDWGLLDRDKSSLKYKENNIKIGLAYTF